MLYQNCRHDSEDDHDNTGDTSWARFPGTAGEEVSMYM
jgi:hypothetical protein